MSISSRSSYTVGVDGGLILVCENKFYCDPYPPVEPCRYTNATGPFRSQYTEETSVDALTIISTGRRNTFICAVSCNIKNQVTFRLFRGSGMQRPNSSKI